MMEELLAHRPESAGSVEWLWLPTTSCMYILLVDTLSLSTIK